MIGHLMPVATLACLAACSSSARDTMEPTVVLEGQPAALARFLARPDTSRALVGAAVPEPKPAEDGRVTAIVVLRRYADLAAFTHAAAAAGLNCQVRSIRVVDRS